MEDTDTTFSEIEERFGEAVRRVVEEVTDDKELPKMERKRLQVERAPGSSPRAKLVKLADKLYNLRDLNRCTPAGTARAGAGALCAPGGLTPHRPPAPGTAGAARGRSAAPRCLRGAEGRTSPRSRPKSLRARLQAAAAAGGRHRVGGGGAACAGGTGTGPLAGLGERRSAGGAAAPGDAPCPAPGCPGATPGGSGRVSGRRSLPRDPPAGAPPTGRDADLSPAGWSSQRVQEYFRWAAQVVAGLRGTNPPLEAALQRLFEERGLDL